MRLIDSELTVIFTLCSVAESNLLTGNLSHADEIMDRVQHATTVARRFIGDAQHVFPESAKEFNRRLRQLDKRVLRVINSVSSQKARAGTSLS
jgi:hypothetical protein